MKKTLWISLVVIACAVNSANAAVLAQYTFTGSSFASSDAHASTASALSVSGWTGSGITTASGNPSPSFRVDKLDAAGTLHIGRYLEFTISSDAGNVLFLSGNALTFDSSSLQANKPGEWVVRSSLDNFASNLASGQTGTTGWSGANVVLGSSFDHLYAVTFRIYLFNEKNVDLFIDNITLNGVTAIPEPTTIALGIFGIGALGAYGWRRLRRSHTA